jgi:hypothetical protein
LRCGCITRKQKNASPCIRTISTCFEESAAAWMETDGERRRHLSGFQEQRRRGAVPRGFEIADGKRCPSMPNPYPWKKGSIKQRLEREVITDGYALPIAELPNLAEASRGTWRHRESPPGTLEGFGLQTGRRLTDSLQLENRRSTRTYFSSRLVDSPQQGLGGSTGLSNVMFRTIRTFRVFISKPGHLAIVLSQVQVGDLVCILFGSSAPFVIRSPQEHFQLTRESYI